MKKGLVIIFQTLIVFIGVVSFAAMLWEPHIEGVNAHATLVKTYFKDPFLAYIYVASSAFYIALYQAFKAVGYAGHPNQTKTVLWARIKAVRTIKECAISIIGFVVVAEIIILANSSSDDRAGGVFIGALVTFVAFAVAALAAKLERKLQTTKI